MLFNLGMETCQDGKLCIKLVKASKKTDLVANPVRAERLINEKKYRFAYLSSMQQKAKNLSEDYKRIPKAISWPDIEFFFSGWLIKLYSRLFLLPIFLHNCRELRNQQKMYFLYNFFNLGKFVIFYFVLFLS